MMEIGPIFRALFRNKARSLVIITEIALTLAIVVNSVNLIADARKKMAVPSGFEDDALIYIGVQPFDEAFKEDQYLSDSIDDDLRLLRSMPGVVQAAQTYFLPWQGGGSSTERKVLNAEGDLYRLQSYFTYGDIVETLGVEVVEGRNFTEDDYHAGNRDILVSKAYADLLFPKGDALGQYLQGRDADNPERIIGIIDPFYNPYPWPIEEYVKFRAGESGDYEYGIDYLVRAEADQVDAVYAALETELLNLDPGRTVHVRSIDEIKDNYFTGEKILMGSMGLVIFLLVFVTSLGIVGLTSFSVAQRTRQIGTRRALGARRFDILRYFLVENWVVTSLGVLLGTLGAFGLNFALVRWVGVVPMNWGLIVGGAVLLWGAGLLSALPPALRGARVPPAIATRNV